MQPIDKILQDMENILHTHNNPVVACSFGKDSEVVLHLAMQVKPDIQVVFNNTLVVRQGLRLGRAWFGMVRRGQLLRGEVRFGVVGLGEARHGKARTKVRCGKVW